ncbi:hypothetical protein PG985_012950 [Apiospora marii]|uniref:Uncharacterized protein n=1 Tax=Apiospora marii TaxID=335849 RepID=A0ABR1RBW5_9PEZI
MPSESANHKNEATEPTTGKIASSQPHDADQSAQQDNRARPWKEPLEAFKAKYPGIADTIDVRKFEERYNSVATG